MSEKVSAQVTDALTQVNVKVVGESPAMAMGNIYMAAAHASGLMFHNAVNAQHNQFILANTATAQGIIQIYSMDTISDAVSLSQVINSLTTN